VREGVLEFEAATADVFEIGAEETDLGGGGDGGAGLVDALLVDEDAAGEDESLGAFAGGGVALVDEELVEADFFGADFIVALFCGVGHSLVCDQFPVIEWSVLSFGRSRSIGSCLYLFMVAPEITWAKE
jgi:hypothetical protein